MGKLGLAVARILPLYALLLGLPALVAAQCVSQLTVQSVSTQDVGGNNKTTFAPGDPIRIIAQINNSSGAYLLAANGTQIAVRSSFYNDTKPVDIPPGVSTWPWNATAPSQQGSYTITAYVYDHFCGVWVGGSGSFTVGQSSMLPNFSFDVASTTGWQTTSLKVTKEQELSFSATGAWNVGYPGPNPLPYVGPDGYSPQVDSTIYQGCKLDAILPYGVLLVRIGNDDPSFIAIGSKDDIPAYRDGFLEFRIHDADPCLGDNAGSVTVSVNTSVSIIKGLSIPSTGQALNFFLDTRYTQESPWYPKYYDQNNILHDHPSGNPHSGVDISNNVNDCDKAKSPVYASAPGTVIWAGWSGPGFGWSVVIKHGYGLRNNGHYTYTLYGHMGTVGIDNQTSQSCLEVQVGNSVTENSLVGYQGSSGLSARATHVHFMVLAGDQDVTALSRLYELIDKYSTYPASPDLYTCMQLTLGDPSLLSTGSTVTRGQNNCP